MFQVLMYSAKYWLVPEAVLSMATLLYPFSYLYPLIPLLPSSLPDAENVSTTCCVWRGVQ